MGWTVRGSNTSGGGGLRLSAHVQTGLGAQAPFCTASTGVLPGSKAAGA